METHKSLFAISHDHFHILMVAQLVQKGAQNFPGLPKTDTAKAKYAVDFYKSELVNHFYLEENVLGPAVRGLNSEIDKILNDMHSEHEVIRQKYEALKEKENLEEKLDHFGKVLEKHVNNEENILFPKIKEVLSKDQLKTLAQKLNKSSYKNI